MLPALKENVAPKRRLPKRVSRFHRNRHRQQTELLIESGWMVQIDDWNEVSFYKHIYLNEGRKILQVMSTNDFGAIYAMKSTLSAYKLEDVRHPETEEICFKLSCNELDLYTPKDEDNLFLTTQDLGEQFFDEVLRRGFISEEELRYFTRNVKERLQIADELPRIIIEDLTGVNKNFIS